MRDIKFRGKRIDNGEWVYGDLIYLDYDYYKLTKEQQQSGCEVQKQKLNPYIKIYSWMGNNNAKENEERTDAIKIEARAYEVDPNTVGQYTGLKDKNRTEIYVGDILKDYTTNTIFEVKFGEFKFKKVSTFTNKPVEVTAIGFYYLDDDNTEMLMRSHVNPEKEFEVISNKYDNPKLLEG